MSVRVGARLRGAFALLVCAGFCAAAASAEVRVNETGGGRLTVVAHDATLRQVLDALRAARPLRLHTSDALASPVTGTYSGSLAHVLSRILDGYNHVIHQTTAGVDLDVFGAGTAARTTASAAASVVRMPHIVPNNGHRVSTNGNPDEEKAATAAARPRAARPPPSVVPVRRAVLTRSAEPSGARISSNVDLDEEHTSR